jgi:hypothetical protein
MRIATYVNGINGRRGNLFGWLDETGPDIVFLQELKAPDENFPARSDRSYRAFGTCPRKNTSPAADPMVRRLSAGAKRIRTPGPAAPFVCLPAVLKVRQSIASKPRQSIRIPAMRHSASSSSWVLTTAAMGFGARGRLW